MNYEQLIGGYMKHLVYGTIKIFEKDFYNEELYKTKIIKTRDFCNFNDETSHDMNQAYNYL